MTEIDPADLPLVLTEPYSVIENVEIDGTHADPACAFAILFRADHCTVRNVHVKKMPRLGIGARGVNYTLIERAHVENCVKQGIWNEITCDGSVVQDCQVFNSGLDNIHFAGKNGTVTRCTAAGAGNGRPNCAGIYMGANSRNTSVRGNVCFGNGTGIDVSWGFQDLPIQISGNDISEGMIVQGNHCNNNNACGIACASNGAIIADNQCFDNGPGSEGRPSSGIGLVNADNCIVTGNVCANSAPDGQSQAVGLVFSVFGASSNISRNCIVTNNHFERNAQYPTAMYFALHLSPVPTTLGNIFIGNFGA